jgi:hypothetical protein
LWKLIGGEPMALGRHMVMVDKDGDTFIHETAHYYQQIVGGVPTFLGRGFYEQGILRIFFPSIDPYNTPGYQEIGARQLEIIYWWNR